MAWALDEHIRGSTTLESLARLPPITHAAGTVTAGTASGINDGAAMLVMTTRGARRGGRRCRPLGRLVGVGCGGGSPEIMGIGPVPAARKALARAGMTIDTMDLVEVNEAFAAQYLAVGA